MIASAASSSLTSTGGANKRRPDAARPAAAQYSQYLTHETTPATTARVPQESPLKKYKPDCPDVVWYICTHWSSSNRQTLLILPKNDYDYWHHRLNLYLCDTWGDVRALGESVYEDAKERFKLVNKDKGYDYGDGEFFADDDEFDCWDDLCCDKRDANPITHIEDTMLSYPYPLRKLMYDDVHHAAFVPVSIRAYGHSPEESEESTEFFPKDKDSIINFIEDSGAQAIKEPGLQDFLLPEAKWGDYRLENTPFMQLYRKKKLGLKYDKMMNKQELFQRARMQAELENKIKRQQQQQQAYEQKKKELEQKMREEEEEDEGLEKLKDKLRDKEGTEYDYAPLPEQGAQGIKAGSRVLCCFTSGWDMGRVADTKRYSKGQKKEAKKMVSPILVHYESDGMYWLHDMGLKEAPYLPHDKFKRLADGSSTDRREGVKPGYWCAVKPKEKTETIEKLL